ncbi:MAG: FapA family protein [Lachnospiraceae bacterium]|nr:FapA family protein [Lachnospiraceae bacterium]
MNGYFQIHISEKGVSLLLFPPTGEGSKPGLSEIREYLDRIGVPYDAPAINSALGSLREDEVAVFLTPNKIAPVSEKCSVAVMADRMTAVLRLYPPSAGGHPIRKNQIMEQIEAQKISYGIDENAIDEALLDKRNCTDIVVARGQQQTAGKDAVIEYRFDTNNDSRPELKEDGSVDFFKLNTLHQCTKGQVLAEIIPAQKGQDGIDVLGKVSPAREVKKATFAHGRNLEISQDGLQLISMVDGHASLVDSTVFVSDVYSVEDVSTATGNIDYHGDVEVKGNVCENFSVKTDGNVFVKGVVEGAVIEAGGNIVIARGMHGQNKGSLKAGGNIIAKFLSAAAVKADGFVEAEQILNSNVEAVNVNVEAGKGLITGGRVTAKSAVNVRNAGSPMGTATIIEVGSDPEMKKRFAELQKSVGEKSKSISQIKSVLEETAMKIKAGAKLLPEQLKNVKILQTTLAQSQAQIQEELKELEELDKLLQGDDNAHINVRGTMYQGVSVAISGASMNVKNEYTFCKLIKKGADIASTTL